MTEKRHAILIGNGSYEAEPALQDLRCPVNDIDGMSKVLTDPDRGGFEQVKVLSDKPSNEITRQIYEVLNAADKDDLVLIYYSGHGKQNRAGNLYLASSDTEISVLEATSVAVTNIRDYISVANCNKIVLVLDCCFSGAAGGVFTKGGVDDQLQMASKGRGTYIITGSTGIQVALEKEDDKYSVFTKHLIGGLTTGEADRDGDGLVTIDELYEHAHDSVLKESPQEPTKWGLDVRGEFVISNSGRVPRMERADKIRKLLLELANEDRIPDQVLTDSIRIVRSQHDQLSPGEQQKDSIIEALYNHKIKASEFVLQWAQVNVSEPVQKKTVKTEPKVEPKPTRPKQRDNENAAEPKKPEISTNEWMDSPHTSKQNTLPELVQNVWLSILIITIAWGIALGASIGAIDHKLLFEDSYYWVKQYRENNKYTYGLYDDDTVPAFGAFGAIASIITILMLRKVKRRLAIPRMIGIFVTSVFGWVLVGIGGGSEGSDEALIFPLIGLTVFALGFGFSLWKPNQVLSFKWAAFATLAIWCSSVIGFFLVADGGANLGSDEGILVGVIWGALIGLFGIGVLVFGLKKQAKPEPG